MSRWRISMVLWEFQKKLMAWRPNFKGLRKSPNVTARIIQWIVKIPETYNVMDGERPYSWNSLNACSCSSKTIKLLIQIILSSIYFRYSFASFVIPFGYIWLDHHCVGNLRKAAKPQLYPNHVLWCAYSEMRCICTCFRNRGRFMAWEIFCWTRTVWNCNQRISLFLLFCLRFTGRIHRDKSMKRGFQLWLIQS